ncbi:MAG TPA: peptidylprolyl isomerase [Ktedonobacterales bacterium]
MSTPTKQRQSRQRPRPNNSAKATRANAPTAKSRARQTARIEGLRDGKPLIFGWGAHLTRHQKHHYQHIATWSFIGVVGLAVIGTILYGVLNENVFIPNQTIVSVNGVKISQDAYRKELAYQAQDMWNTMQSEIAQLNTLKAKVAQGDVNAYVQNSVVTSQLQSNEANYAQTQITQSAVSTLEDNALILAAEQRFEQQNHTPASAFEPTQKQVNDALAAFKKAFPNGETYAQFISANNLSDSDVINSITIKLRRDKMQTYLSGKLVSPARQVHLRRIQADTAAHAAKVRAELVKGGNTDALWTSLAKTSSLDPSTKDTGGDMGWVPAGTGDGGIELWAYASGRKAGDLSPVISDTTGTYDVVQIIAIDPSRPVDAAALKAAQDNALPHYLNEQRSVPGAKITTADTNMLTASRNLPKKPSLSAALPQITPSAGAGSGIPGMPGGVGTQP